MISPHHGTVLITGFGPFPGVADNVSAGVALALTEASREKFPTFRFESAILPVEWERTPQILLATLTRLKPVITIHFGVAASTSGFRLESAAHNECRCTIDAIGCLPPSPAIISGGAELKLAKLPFNQIVDALTERNLPVTVSSDAGGYLCNATLYHSIVDAETTGRRALTGFVHIPQTLDGPPLDFEQAIIGGIEIVRCAIESLSGTDD